MQAVTVVVDDMRCALRQVATQSLDAVRAIRHDRELAQLSALFSNAASAVPNAGLYRDLHPLSLAASSLSVNVTARRHVTVVLPEVGPAKIFAGIRTALQFASGVADALNLPLRIICLWDAPTGKEIDRTISYLDAEFSRPRHAVTTIIGVEAMADLIVSPEDLWIVTHWTTAHPLDIASRLGIVDPNRVVYLIQDYEPGFTPWSTSFALARATYHAGFHQVVNSSPLQKYLDQYEGIRVPDELVFAPSLDLERLAGASAKRVACSDPQIMFYGRPSKPRNLFNIGLCALRIAASEFESQGIRVKFVSAGESHRSFELSRHSQLTSLGKVSWADYFALLSQSDVVLSLQHSPHPSHPPLDAVATGAAAVTNEMAGTRATIHPRLTAVEPDPVPLARAIVCSALQLRDQSPAHFSSDFLAALGRPLEAVVAKTVLLAQ